MSYQAVVREEDELFIDSIYKLLKVKAGDKIIWDLKDGTIQIKKSEASVPVSCRALTPEETGKELLKAIESVEKGEVYSEQEVWNMLDELEKK